MGIIVGCEKKRTIMKEINNLEVFLLGLVLIALIFTFLGINYLLTRYLLKRCPKCFHLLEKQGNCKYCERQRNDYE
jgi:hypothetical protein